MISANALSGAALKARIERDLQDLATGQRGAALHMRFADGLQPSNPSDGRLLQSLEAELPAKATLELGENGSIVVWLPRTTYQDVTTLARTLRSVGQQQRAPSANANHQFPTERAFAIGVLLIDHAAWEVEALLATTEVTSAMALIGGNHQIRFANQVRSHN